MMMALRYGCLLGAVFLLCTVHLSFAQGREPLSCFEGSPLPRTTCGKNCPGNYDCAIGNHRNQGICCPIGFLGHPPPYSSIGETYLEVMFNLLIPKDRLFDHVLSVHFQAPPQTISDVCGQDLLFPAVDTVVTGEQEAIGKPALAIGCDGVERNLGTAVYRLKPDVTFKIRSMGHMGHMGHMGELMDPSPSDRFCVFMFDIGTDPTPGDDTDEAQEHMVPFYLRNYPYIHWTVCNIPGNNINDGTTIRPFQQVPSNAAPTRRITYVLFKQPREQPDINVNTYLESPTEPLCLPSQDRPLCSGCKGCRFDIRRFIQTYQVEAKAFLTLRAASDAVGLNMIRDYGRLTTQQMCGIYNQANEEHAATEDGSH